MLLRGCALDNIDEEDMDILLNDYNLKTIIDLRTDREVKERTDILRIGTKIFGNRIYNK